MRVLGRVRLSRSREESTSVERQRDLIQTWADTNGHEVVAWAEDTDVSGSISPFDTPGLGPYLTPEGVGAWDILVSWKLDRLARSSIALHRLFGWVQDNEKQLVCISDNIDLSTWVGRMVAGVIAGVAEGELEAITERVTAGQKALREQGRYRGGTPSYGYTQEKADVGWKLVKHPGEQKILQRMISMALAGSSMSSIAATLNEQGIKTKRGAEWTANAVTGILSNKNLLGWTTHNGVPVLGVDGQPIRKCDPSISLEDYNTIQRLRESRSFSRTSPEGNSPLLGVIVCWWCGARMHYRRGKTPAGNAYRCQSCDDRRFINAAVAEATVGELFAEELAGIPVYRRTSVQGSAQDLEEARETYADIASFLGSAPDAETRKALFQQLNLVGDRIKLLEQGQAQAGAWEPTGETYGQQWERLDEQGRRRMLVTAGVKFRARIIQQGTRWNPPVLETELLLPEHLESLLREAGR